MCAVGGSGWLLCHQNQSSTVSRNENNNRAAVSEFRIENPTQREIVALSELVGDQAAADRETRRLAAFKLARVGKEAALHCVPKLKTLVSGDGPDTVWATKALATFGVHAESATGEMIGLLQSDKPDIRNGAIETLAAIGTANSKVIPAIRNQLRNWSSVSDAEQKLSLEFLIDSVGTIGPDAVSCLPSVMRFIDHNDTRIRTAAANVIGKMGPRGEIAVSSLMEALVFDESPEVQDAAVTSLAAIGSAAVPALQRLLRSDDPMVIRNASHALGEIGQPARQALPALVAASESSDANVRLAAARAIDRVSDGMIDVSPILLKLLSNSDRSIRMLVVKTFSLVGPSSRNSSVMTQLQKLAESGSAVAKQAAKKVLRDLRS